jgi:catechol 2,3-dioxygenase-like lactoylglutathione lyase family enzyme
VDGVTTTPEARQPGVAFGLEWARWDAHILIGAGGFEGGAIDLLEWKEPAPVGHPPRGLHQTGFQRVGLMVADLDRVLADVRAGGGDAWGEPTTFDVPGGRRTRLALVSDPDGTTVELVEGDGNRVSFVAVASADLDRSVDFYRSLGFRELMRFPTTRDSAAHLRIDGPVAMVEVLLAAPGGGEVRLMLVGFDRPSVQPGSSRPANALGMWRTALLVPDLDAAVAGLRAAEIELLSEPQSMSMGPGLPELRFVCFRGPDHEVIELIEQPDVG